MNPQSQQPNYDFILNPQKAPKGPVFGNSKKQRIIILSIGVVLAIIVIMIVSNLIGAASGKSNEAVLDLAAYQTELKRVISLGNDKARSASIKNKALTATYTLESDIALTGRIMTSRGLSPPKDLATRYSGTQSDQTLDAAEKANNFDAVYDELYKEKLSNYKVKLSEIYPQLKPAEQVLVKQQNDHVKVLLGEPLEQQ